MAVHRDASMVTQCYEFICESNTFRR
jgi:hypothetical protein